MSVALTGSGGLFTRLGHIFGGMLDVDALRGGSATVRTLSGASWDARYQTILADLAAGTPIPQVADNLDRLVNSWQSSQRSFLSNLARTYAAGILIQMVDDDAHLSSRTLPLALAELNRQMRASVDSVKATTATVGAQTAVGSPTGNGSLVVSVKNGQGEVLQYLFGETLKFVCTADSESGGATLFQEQLNVTGRAPTQSAFDHLWPLGSGGNVGLTAVNASLDNSGGNLLQNSDFELFTNAPSPDNWTIILGAAGIAQSSTPNAYVGSSALQLTGDGSTIITLAQKFATAPTTVAGAGGTPATLLPGRGSNPQADAIYHLNGWLKVDAAPSAGQVEFSLVDGSNAIIADDAGTDNMIVIDGMALTNTYKALGKMTTEVLLGQLDFRLPAVLPAVIKLKIKTSTAWTSPKILFIDHLSLTQAAPFYIGGPFLSYHGGSAALVFNDTWTKALTVTAGVFQRAFERCFGMRNLGLQLPSAGSPSINDNLVA